MRIAIIVLSLVLQFIVMGPALAQGKAAPPQVARLSLLKLIFALQALKNRRESVNQGNSGSMPYGGGFGQKLLINDNFARSTTLNPTIWSVPEGAWSNDIYYTAAKNVLIKNGLLNLMTIKENFVIPRTGKTVPFTTPGVRSKLQLTYGVISFRARMSPGEGLRPALWLRTPPELYGTGGKSGEIDLFECHGNSDEFYSTVWGFTTGGAVQYHQPVVVGNAQPWQGPSVPIKVDTSQWHRYTLNWQPGECIFSLDGQVYADIKQPWITSTPMELVMSTGVSAPTANTPAVSTMQISDVQVYSNQYTKIHAGGPTGAPTQ